MRARRRIIALLAGVSVAIGAGVTFASTGFAATALTCSGTVWAESNTVSYTAGQQVTYQAHLYQALVTHTPWVGAGWNPASTPTLWKDLGACTGGGGGSSPTPTSASPRPTTASPTPTRSASPSPTPTSASPSPSVTPTQPGGSTCALKQRPGGKVLQGYWENWDGASNGVHPGLGWIPMSDSRIAQHGYNVINAAFPVINADGTVLWQDGMDATVKVGTPADVCAAKAAGATVLMSIGGATAAVNLNSTAAVDKFVSTIVPILKKFNFDGIDIDIESGLTGNGSFSNLAASQTNLIRLIDGVLGQMPAGFGLTMAPETAYVTGASVAFNGIWGSYLPIIKKYLDNGRLWWLNMQYYNGSMYGCTGDSYNAGTVQGFTAQTQCLNNGLTVGGVTVKIPYDKQVPGLPAQSGAGGGYMSTSLVTQAYNSVSSIKGLMTWSINWTFGDNVKRLQGR